MSLSRHTAYNVLGQALPLAVSFFAIPIYLRLIGEARFGILALIWLFFGYLGLFDFGLGRAIARQLARLRGEQDSKQASVLSTALLVSLSFGVIGAVMALPLGSWFFTQHAAIESSLRSELLAALPWAGALVPLTTVASVGSGALVARSAFGELSIINATGNVLATLAPLAVAASYQPLLPALLIAVVAVRMAIVVWILWRCRRHYVDRNFLIFDIQVAAQLLHFGGWATLSAIISPIMVMTDRFAIGVQLGSREVSHYAIPFQLAEQSTIFSSALNQTLFPRHSNTSNEGDQRNLAMLGLETLIILTSLPIAGVLLLAGPLLSWWLTPEFAAHSTGAAQILFFSFWINGLALVPYTKLFASGRSDLVAKCHLLELPPYLLVLYFSLEYWGVAGAAVAFGLRVAVDFLLLAHLGGILSPALRVTGVPALLLGTLTGAALITDLSSIRWELACLVLPILLGWIAIQARSRFATFNSSARSTRSH